MFYNKKSYRHLLISIVMLFFLVSSPGYAGDTPKESSDSTTPNPPLIGETLLKTKKDLLEKSDEQKRKIESLNQEISRFTIGEMFGLGEFFRYSRVRFAVFILILCIWTSLLLFMYRNIRREEYFRYKKILLKVLYLLFALGLVCVITRVASASTCSSCNAPKYELPTTLEHVKKMPSMASRLRVLEALEEQNCSSVEIPQDVLSFISQNCPDAVILNPIKGQGPHRLAARAAIHWASGDKPKALAVLKPIVDSNFYGSLPESRAGFETALSFFAASNDTVATTKLARQMMFSYNAAGLVWMAKKIRACCFEVANQALDRASGQARTPQDVVFVAKALKDFARYEDCKKLIIDHQMMTFDNEGLEIFLRFCKSEGQEDIEQHIISWNIDQRNWPNELINLASVFINLGYSSPAKRALEKAVEKENQTKGLTKLASFAIQWNMFDVARASLVKIVDAHGFDGASMEFSDPMLLPVSPEKPVDQNPSIGIVIGILSEKLSDLTTAETYYTENINFEIYNTFICLGTARDINFANFFYPYRFYVSHNKTHLVELLDPIGRELENHLVSEFKNKMEQEIKAQEKEIHRLRVLKMKNFILKISKTLFLIFVVIFIVILIIAHVVAVQRTLEWISRLDHLKMLGGCVKFLELVGFIFGPSILFIFIGMPLILTSQGLVLILTGQFILSIYLNEANTFRVVEHFRTGKLSEWLKLPLTYKD